MDDEGEPTWHEKMYLAECYDQDGIDKHDNNDEFGLFGTVLVQVCPSDHDFFNEIRRRAIHHARNAHDDAEDMPIDPSPCNPFIFAIKVMVSSAHERR